jgi:hypothetical protein
MTFSRHLIGSVTVLLVGAASADTPRYIVPRQTWEAALGSHRAVMRVDVLSAAVRARLDWRRRDGNPQSKAVLVVNAATGTRIANSVAVEVTNEVGEVVFEPAAAGEYFVYYLPVTLTGGAFPVSHYRAPDDKADPAWKVRCGLNDGGWKKLPAAHVVRWESRSMHDAWNEMEVIATRAEVDALAAKFADRPVALFAEDRAHSVRMFDLLPARWVDRAAGSTPKQPELSGPAGGVVPFQIVAWTHHGAVEQAGVRLGAFSGPDRAILPAARLTCVTSDGVDWTGQPLSRPTNIAANRVQPFWCIASPPVELSPGRYQGEATFFARIDGKPYAEKLPLTLDIGPAVPAGADPLDGSDMSRLGWLNSTLGSDDTPTKGYTPIRGDGLAVSCLGRRVRLGPEGLPTSIVSYFSPDNTKIVAGPGLELLAAPIRLSVTDANGGSLTGTSAVHMAAPSAGSVAWTAETAIAGGWTLSVAGSMQFDGSIAFACDLVPAGPAAVPIDVRDVRLELPRTPRTTPYVIGLGQPAGPAAEFDWKWQTADKHQDSVWLGAVNSGIRLQLRERNYERPSINIHYKRRPLVDPVVWGNGGRGGVSYHANRLLAFTGPRRLDPARPLRFDFTLLVTPFHPLNTAAQWTDRYYHTGQVPADIEGYLDKAKAAGCTVINVHQGNRLNPYINYPFLNAAMIRAFCDAAHRRGQRVKLYYTIRELTNWAPELFALRSMGDEIFPHGKGGGHPWLEEHLGGDYWGAWYEPSVQDASLLTRSLSRWNNYYVEGLDWLCRTVGCDGIYLDDISYDRSTMIRVRRVLDRACLRGGLVDLHSWNEFHEGGAWAQCANLFMDSLPFVDRLWFGEGHHYEGPSPEHFLVEISGIPFGLMGEMLENGGNPWMGLVHGCTGRLGWQGNPQAVWKLWDDFGLTESDFIGWWAGAACPVRTGDPLVKATVWKKPGRVLIAVANFAKEPRRVTLEIDRTALGLPADAMSLRAPPMAGLQLERTQSAKEPVVLPPFGGAAFVIDASQVNAGH